MHRSHVCIEIKKLIKNLCKSPQLWHTWQTCINSRLPLMRTESLIHFSFFSLSSFVSMWPLQENEGGAQEITADPLCSPLPLIFTHSGNTSQIKACITTRVCMCVCFYLPATHTQGVFSCPDPCSLNCVHADLTHTHTYTFTTNNTQTALLVVFPLP